MSEAKFKDDEITPGEEPSEQYHAHGLKCGRGYRQFLWFVSHDKKNDQIFQIADIRRMEPPSDPDNEVAFIHFGGASVAMSGKNLRQVLFRIMMGRCDILYEYRPGQTKPDRNEPIIYSMVWADMTNATRKEKPESGALQ